MKKLALVFVVAVIMPSLVLAWLAVRSLRDQRLVLERQQTLLYQGVADAVATRVQRAVDRQRADFQSVVTVMLRDKSPRLLANQFHTDLQMAWPMAEVGFAVSLDEAASQVIAPSPFNGAEARRFRVQNDLFLCSSQSVEVYINSPKGAISLSKLDQKDAAKDLKWEGIPGLVPQEKATASDKSGSRVAPEAAAFRQIVGDSESGSLARFLQDRLHLLMWTRAPSDPQLIFGAQIRLDRLIEAVRSELRVDASLNGEVLLALLNDAGRPVALSLPDREQGWRIGAGDRPALGRGGSLGGSGRNAAGASSGASPIQDSDLGLPDWGRPFVATGVGDVLPHWEVAVYLLDPGGLDKSAQSLRLTLALLVALLVLAIAVGSWLIVADLKRELARARQKTDFVSNVSHELKTPLTSIRMFSELLSENRIDDPAKRRQFLEIITTEAARLTRLIDNVLDFARLERGESHERFIPCDLVALARETLESYSCQLRLKAPGHRLAVEAPDTPLFVKGDRDALSQVMVNLVSNAEKYSGSRPDIQAELSCSGDSVRFSVLDRGPGVPSGCEERIFEQFYRAHDSLASGIPGSGLGLTLARQIARAHGGDVEYQPREGGGSRFTLCLPVLGSIENPAGAASRSLGGES